MTVLGRCLDLFFSSFVHRRRTFELAKLAASPEDHSILAEAARFRT